MNAQKVRIGAFCSQRRAIWYKRASKDIQLLHGQPDSTVHAFSGCPGMESAVTTKHNRRVALLGYFVLKPVCIGDDASTQQQEGIQPILTRMPTKVLPSAMPQEERRKPAAKHHPDLVLCERLEQVTTHVHTFVEVKYCQDTQPQDDITKAEVQHAEMFETLHSCNAAGNIAVVS